MAVLPVTTPTGTKTFNKVTSFFCTVAFQFSGHFDL